MRKPPRLLVVALSIPFLTGCFTVAQVAVPPVAAAREEVDVRGVVVRHAGGTEEVVRFDEVHEVVWTPTALSVVADVSVDGATQTITQLYPISTLSGLLVKQLDAGVTSAIIGGVILGAIAFVAVAVTGGTNPGTWSLRPRATTPRCGTVPPQSCLLGDVWTTVARHANVAWSPEVAVTTYP